LKPARSIDLSDLSEKLPSREIASSIMTGSLPRIYAVVLNWENFSETRLCLNSLCDSGYPNLRTIVVDNGSQDCSVDMLRKEFPELTLLINEFNLGFARGCNVGIRQALQDSECAYVFLLNNDATILTGRLRSAVELAESDPRIGLISGKVLSSSESKTIWYAGGRLNRLRGQAIVRGFGEVDQGQYDSVCDVGFVTGALMLIKRVVLEVVGLLPEEYFFGVEEWDYSLATHRAGYRLCYVPDFAAFHRGDGSHWNYDPKFVYNYYRNKLLFQEKFLPKGLFPLWRMFFVLYGKYWTRRHRQKLIDQYDKGKAVPVDDLDFALTEAIKDHRKNSLSAQTLQEFEEKLVGKRRIAN
jgi:GT2 family glycosyltransferase